MKILLDECVPKRVKKLLSPIEVYTLFDLGWNGLKNGELLSKTASSNFDILISIDKNISSQKNINQFNVALVIFDVKNSRTDDYAELVE